MRSSETRRAWSRGAIVNRLSRALPIVVGATALMGAAASAVAGTNGLSVSVDSLITPDSDGVKWVSYSLPGGTSYAGYAVAIANPTHANIQNAWLKFSTATDQPGLAAPFDPALLPSKCKIDPYVPLNTGVVCNFSQADLVPGTAFSLLVPVPPAPAGGEASLSLHWTLQAGQGKADANHSAVAQEGSQVLVLRVGSPTNVRTWARAGDTVSVEDTAATHAKSAVKPPKGATVGLQQEIVLESCSPQYLNCLKSTLGILDGAGVPITFDPPFLAIDLLRPASSLGPYANIANSRLSYQESASSPPQDICPCINGPSWQIPPGQDRCVVPPYPANGLTFADALGFHFHVIAKKNGIINW